MLTEDDVDVDPEDILEGALYTLYDYQPITLTSSGSVFSYTVSSPRSCRGQETSRNPTPDSNPGPCTIILRTPDTHPSNWSLHASSIWASSQNLADHLDELHLDSYFNDRDTKSPLHVLELGAGAGLPGIVIAKTYPDTVLVTCSDYPDEKLIQTLKENIVSNRVERNCRAIAYAWGSDPVVLKRTWIMDVADENREREEGDGETHLNSEIVSRSDMDSEKGHGHCKDLDGFDIIIAADTLFNPGARDIFIESLKLNLKKAPSARVHLVAGLHTGRYTLQKFLDTVVQPENGLEIESVVERETMGGTVERPWDVLWAERFEDNMYVDVEKERRRWVVWMILKWSKKGLEI